MHAGSTYTGNVDSLQRHGAMVPPDNLLHPFGRRRHGNLRPVGRDRPADPRGVDELQVLHAGAVLYGGTCSKSMDQTDKVANPARGELNRKK